MRTPLNLGRFLWTGALALLLTGCAGYRLGPTNELAAGQKSIQIAPIVNRTLQPRLNDTVENQLRKAFQHDGTYRLATHGDGDLVLKATLVRYDRAEILSVPNDVLTVSDYRLSVVAQVTVVDRSTGKTVFDQPVTGFTLMQVGNDISSAERQSTPSLAADLARNIADLLVDGKW
jgi:hypothetical protein